MVLAVLIRPVEAVGVGDGLVAVAADVLDAVACRAIAADLLDRPAFGEIGRAHV